MYAHWKSEMIRFKLQIQKIKFVVKSDAGSDDLAVKTNQTICSNSHWKSILENIYAYNSEWINVTISLPFTIIWTVGYYILFDVRNVIFIELRLILIFHIMLCVLVSFIFSCRFICILCGAVAERMPLITLYAWQCAYA